MVALIGLSLFSSNYIFNQVAKLFNKPDIAAPTLTLKGAQVINLNLWDTYTDAGALAIDKHDGDLSAKIVVTNNVNTSRIGSYHVTYSIKDEAGNEAQTQRDINVLAPTANNTVGIPILMYHFFYNSAAGETPQDGNFADSVIFDQQMKYLKDNQYYFPTWTELASYLDGNLNLPEKSVIITDDDGSSTFFSLAYPVLAKYQILATSFLITSWSGDPAQFNVDRNLISFQSHSHAMHTGGCDTGHSGLFQCIDYQAGYDDLTTSKTILGSSDAFCYPFGDYNDFTKQLLKDTGYKVAVTTEYGFAKIGMDKLALPRIRIQGTTDLAGFIASIE